MTCQRCGSRTMARTYDPDGKGTLPVCLACGNEDYAGYYPVRLLPRFVTRTVVSGPQFKGRTQLRYAKAIAMFQAGATLEEVRVDLVCHVRTAYRLFAWYRQMAEQRQEVAS